MEIRMLTWNDRKLAKRLQDAGANVVGSSDGVLSSSEVEEIFKEEDASEVETDGNDAYFGEITNLDPQDRRGTFEVDHGSWCTYIWVKVSDIPSDMKSTSSGISSSSGNPYDKIAKALGGE